MADGGTNQPRTKGQIEGRLYRNELEKRKILAGGRVAIQNTLYWHEYLKGLVGQTIEIAPLARVWAGAKYQANITIDGEGLVVPLFPLPGRMLDPEETIAERNCAIEDIGDILEKFKDCNPGNDHLVLDILESAGKLALPGYSVQVITSPVGTGQW